MRADDATRREVTAVLLDVMDAYASQDLERTLSHYLDDDGQMNIGTGGEKSVGRAALARDLTRDFGQITSLSAHLPMIDVRSRDDVAWVAADLVLEVNGMRLDTRWTVVLVRDGGPGAPWKIDQSHLSLPCDLPAGQASA